MANNEGLPPPKGTTGPLKAPEDTKRSFGELRGAKQPREALEAIA